MSHPIISVENLGKDYVISHQGSEGSYRTLRDTLSDVFRKPATSNQKSEIFSALHDVSFEVQQGEVLGIIGRNGAGKSTLLKILSRITEPTRGRVHLRGRVASLLEVGTGFHPELTGRENIFLNGAILGMTRTEIRKKFDEIVDFSGVEKFLDTPVKRYSSGMYVRLAFAVAAHLEPEILIVDEVLAVGDAEFQKKCLGTMEKVANSGRTVLFVSHNMTTVDQLCGRCLILNQGKIEVIGPTQTVTESYLHPPTTNAGHPLHTQKSHPHLLVTRVFARVDGRDTLNITAGERVELCLSYECSHPESYPAGFQASFIFWARGEKIVNFWSNAGHGKTFPVTNSGSIVCNIPRWPFRHMPIQVEIHLNYRMDSLVEIPQALTLESEDGNYFGNGIIPHAAEGWLLMDHSWSSL